MISFVVVKTKAGAAHIRPDRVVAVNATDAEECIILMTDGVTIAAREPAADVVARLESAERSADETAKP
jgi:hypothetical protein